jgi:alpha-tubulin suppressor-like RCC1 family protein
VLILGYGQAVFGTDYLDFGPFAPDNICYNEFYPGHDGELVRLQSHHSCDPNGNYVHSALEQTIYMNGCIQHICKAIAGPDFSIGGGGGGGGGSDDHTFAFDEICFVDTEGGCNKPASGSGEVLVNELLAPDGSISVMVLTDPPAPPAPFNFDTAGSVSLTTTDPETGESKTTQTVTQYDEEGNPIGKITTVIAGAPTDPPATPPAQPTSQLEVNYSQNGEPPSSSFTEFNEDGSSMETSCPSMPPCNLNDPNTIFTLSQPNADGSVIVVQCEGDPNCSTDNADQVIEFFDNQGNPVSEGEATNADVTDRSQDGDSERLETVNCTTTEISSDTCPPKDAPVDVVIESPVADPVGGIEIVEFGCDPAPANGVACTPENATTPVTKTIKDKFGNVVSQRVATPRVPATDGSDIEGFACSEEFMLELLESPPSVCATDSSDPSCTCNKDNSDAVISGSIEPQQDGKLIENISDVKTNGDGTFDIKQSLSVIDPTTGDAAQIDTSCLGEIESTVGCPVGSASVDLVDTSFTDSTGGKITSGESSMEPASDGGANISVNHSASDPSTGAQSSSELNYSNITPVPTPQTPPTMSEPPTAGEIGDAVQAYLEALDTLPPSDATSGSVSAGVDNPSDGSKSEVKIEFASDGHGGVSGESSFDSADPQGNTSSDVFAGDIDSSALDGADFTDPSALAEILNANTPGVTHVSSSSGSQLASGVSQTVNRRLDPSSGASAPSSSATAATAAAASANNGASAAASTSDPSTAAGGASMAAAGAIAASVAAAASSASSAAVINATLATAANASSAATAAINAATAATSAAANTSDPVLATAATAAAATANAAANAATSAATNATNAANAATSAATNASVAAIAATNAAIQATNAANAAAAIAADPSATATQIQNAIDLASSTAGAAAVAADAAAVATQALANALDLAANLAVVASSATAHAVDSADLAITAANAAGASIALDPASAAAAVVAAEVSSAAAIAAVAGDSSAVQSGATEAALGATAAAAATTAHQASDSATDTASGTITAATAAVAIAVLAPDIINAGTTVASSTLAAATVATNAAAAAVTAANETATDPLSAAAAIGAAAFADNAAATAVTKAAESTAASNAVNSALTLANATAQAAAIAASAVQTTAEAAALVAADPDATAVEISNVITAANAAAANAASAATAAASAADVLSLALIAAADAAEAGSAAADTAVAAANAAIDAARAAGSSEVLDAGAAAAVSAAQSAAATAIALTAGLQDETSGALYDLVDMITTYDSSANTVVGDNSTGINTQNIVYQENYGHVPNGAGVEQGELISETLSGSTNDGQPFNLQISHNDNGTSDLAIGFSEIIPGPPPRTVTSSLSLENVEQSLVDSLVTQNDSPPSISVDLNAIKSFNEQSDGATNSVTSTVYDLGAYGSLQTESTVDLANPTVADLKSTLIDDNGNETTAFCFNETYPSTTVATTVVDSSLSEIFNPEFNGGCGPNNADQVTSKEVTESFGEQTTLNTTFVKNASGENSIAFESETLAPDGESILSKLSKTCSSNNVVLETKIDECLLSDASKASGLDVEFVEPQNTENSFDIINNGNGTSTITLSEENENVNTGSKNTLSIKCSAVENLEDCKQGSEFVTNIEGSVSAPVDASGDLDGDGIADAQAGTEFVFKENGDGTFEVTMGSSVENTVTETLDSESFSCSPVADVDLSSVPMDSVNNTSASEPIDPVDLADNLSADSAQAYGLIAASSCNIKDSFRFELEDKAGNSSGSGNMNVKVDGISNGDGGFIVTSVFEVTGSNGLTSTVKYQCLVLAADLMLNGSEIETKAAEDICNSTNGETTGSTELITIGAGVTQETQRVVSAHDENNENIIITIKDENLSQVHIVRCLNIPKDTACEGEFITSESYVGLAGDGSDENAGVQVDISYLSGGPASMVLSTIDKDPDLQTTDELVMQCNVDLTQSASPISSGSGGVELLDNVVENLCSVETPPVDTYEVKSKKFLDGSLMRTEIHPYALVEGGNTVYDITTVVTQLNGSSVTSKCLEKMTSFEVCDVSVPPNQVIEKIVEILPGGEQQIDIFDLTIGINGGSGNQLLRSSMLISAGGDTLFDINARCSGSSITMQSTCNETNADSFTSKIINVDGSITNHTVLRENGVVVLNEITDIVITQTEISKNTVSMHSNGDSTSTSEVVGLDHKGSITGSTGYICKDSGGDPNDNLALAALASCEPEDASERFTSDIIINIDGSLEMTTNYFNAIADSEPIEFDSTPSGSYTCDASFEICTEGNAFEQSTDPTTRTSSSGDEQTVTYVCDASVKTCNDISAHSYRVLSSENTYQGSPATITLICGIGVEFCTAAEAQSKEIEMISTADYPIMDVAKNVARIDPRTDGLGTQLIHFVEISSNPDTGKNQVISALRVSPEDKMYQTVFLCESDTVIETCDQDSEYLTMVTSSELSSTLEGQQVTSRHCKDPATGLEYCLVGAPVEISILSVNGNGGFTFYWRSCPTEDCTNDTATKSQTTDTNISPEGKETTEVTIVTVSGEPEVVKTETFVCPGQVSKCSAVNAISGTITNCPADGGTCIVEHIDVETLDEPSGDGGGLCFSSDPADCLDNSSTGNVFIKQLVTSDSHNCILISDSTIHCWGTNDSYQLGTNPNDFAAGGECGDAPNTKAPSTPINFENSVAIFDNGYPGYEGVCDDVTGDASQKGFPSVYAGVLPPIAGTFPSSISVSGVFSGSRSELGEYDGKSLLASTVVAYDSIGDGNVKIKGFGDNTFTASNSFNNKFILRKKHYVRVLDHYDVNSNPVYRNDPIDVDTKITQISSSVGFLCVIATDDQVYCYGSNSQGQLGNGTYVDFTTPRIAHHGWPEHRSLSGSAQDFSTLFSAGSTKVVTGGNDISGIGAPAACSLANDNKVYCWGSNKYRLLQNNQVEKYSRADDMAGISNALDISYNGFSACALVSSGALINGEAIAGQTVTAQCWGNNIAQSYVQESHRSYNGVDTKIAISLPEGTSFKKLKLFSPNSNHIVTAGTQSSSYACAIGEPGIVPQGELVADHTFVWCWGSVFDETVNDSTYGYKYQEPKKVLKLTGATSLSAAKNQVCAIIRDGKSVACVGRSQLFQAEPVEGEAQ